VLVVAATARELGDVEGVTCGIGPVEAAAVTARALVLRRPALVLHVGLAGGRGLEPGDVVIGTESVYVDLSAAIAVVTSVEPAAELVAAAGWALPSASQQPIGTSASVGALRGSERDDVAVEAMEGFGVLRACELAGVPAVEVRVISNEIGEEDRGRWEIERALEVLHGAVPRLLDAFGE
jgi:nucleoside phosphorylase